MPSDPFAEQREREIDEFVIALNEALKSKAIGEPGLAVIELALDFAIAREKAATHGRTNGREKHPRRDPTQ